MRSIPLWSLGMPLVVGSFVLARAAFAPDAVDVAAAARPGSVTTSASGATAQVIAGMPGGVVPVAAGAGDGECPMGSSARTDGDTTAHAGAQQSAGPPRARCSGAGAP